jgi:hypothetical protein
MNTKNKANTILTASTYFGNLIYADSKKFMMRDTYAWHTF